MRRKTTEMSLKLDEKMRTAIADTAKKRGLSASELVRNAVAAALGVCPTCGQDYTHSGRRAQATT